MPLLKALGGNPLVNICFLAWTFAQVLKTFFDYLVQKQVNLERLVGAGGMPSSHSALVSSLAVGMARLEGFQSPLFALSLAFAGVVMYDAMGVRRSAGEQAKILNKLINTTNLLDMIKHPIVFEEDQEEEEQNPAEGQGEQGESEAQNQKNLKESLGHTPLEVLAGSLLGMLVAIIYPI